MKNKVVKIIKISIIAFLALIITLCSTVFLIVHSFISKMNIVHDSKAYEVSENQRIDEETDEIILDDLTDIADSPQEVIDEVEESIRENTENVNQEISSEDVYNILLIGSDSREAGGLGRSDAMIIASVNSKMNKIVLTSLLRDIYLDIPSHKNNRLNAAYAYGGADLLIDTIERNFQIEIDKYVSIDFYAFIDVVDSIDGVNLEVKEEYLPIINFYIGEINQHNGVDESDGLLTEAGNYPLNGKQTLGYVRNRYIGTDFERTGRQRIVLEKIFDKIKNLHYFKILNLLDKVLPQVTTNISEKKIISLLSSLPSYKNYEIEQWSIPMKDTYSFLTINRMSVIGIDFEKNIKELHKKVYE
jgi:LCP family protein required for cell wall assembly